MTFTMEKQVDPKYGCIPACARAVLKWMGEANIPSEEILVQAMWHGALVGSGFARLRNALQPHGLTYQTKVEVPKAKEHRLLELVQGRKPVLWAVNNEGALHCVVVFRQVGQVLEVFDPDPNSGSPQSISVEDLVRRSCGDLAYFS